MAYVPVNIEEAVGRECRRRKYSERTIETYQNCIRRFIQFTGKTIDKISKADANEFLSYLSEKGYSGNSIHVYHMSVRFLMEDILHKNMRLNIKYSKKSQKLPRVLDKEEVKKLFSAIDNNKHRLMIKMIYSAGLRVSELINLKAGDLEIEKNFGFVRGGKGNKDRIFIISEKLKPEITKLIEAEKLNSEDNLFLTNRGEKYNIRSLQEIIKKASKIAKLSGVHCHTLRHSFATHLIENGSSVSEVQSLLGHKSPETTMVYVHLASPSMIKTKSPLDSI